MKIGVTSWQILMWDPKSKVSKECNNFSVSWELLWLFGNFYVSK